MITSDFIDDQQTVNTRIAQHEARLGLPASGPLDDIARANMILRGLELMPTPTAPAAPASPPTATGPKTPAVSTHTATGRHLVAQAFATNQPPARQNQATRHTTNDGELQGVARLAAHYVQHAKSTPKA